MKRKLILLITTLTLVIMGAMSLSFNYDSDWDSVAKNARKSPKEALSSIEKIELKAQKENNIPQQLRCMVYRDNILREERYNDAFTQEYKELDFIKKLQDFRAKLTDAAAIAICKYLESNVFEDYFDSNYYDISRRTDIVGLIPEDIKEWPANLFIDTIHKLRYEAITEPAIRVVKTAEYEALFNLKDVERLCCPTLFDILVQDITDIGKYRPTKIFTKEEQLSFINELIEFHKDDKDKSALVMAKLDAVNLNTKNWKGQLSQLLETYKNDPASVLIRIEFANALIGGKQFIDTPENNSKKNIDEVNLALQICNEGIKQYPRHEKIDLLKNIIKEIETPDLNISLDNTSVHENNPIKLKVCYANLTELKATLYRYDADIKDLAQRNKEKLKRNKVNDFQFKLERSNYLLKKDTAIEIPALPAGVYALEFTEKKLKSHWNTIDFTVTNLAVLHTSDCPSTNYIVVDNQNGAPRKGVNMDFYTNNNTLSQEGTVETNADGFAEIKKTDCHLYINLKDGNDKYKWINHYAYYNERKRQSGKDSKVTILTDRSIYRPGQTVHYKCIAYELGENTQKVSPNEKITIEINDANYQTIHKIELTTNAFGSVVDSFSIPENGLSGNYTFLIQGENIYYHNNIRVEEYKRPTFEIGLTQPTGSYSFGDSIAINGNVQYLLGTPVQGAQVKYTITKTPYTLFWWRHYNDFSSTIVASGTVTSNNKGEFTLNFTPENDEDDDERPIYNYAIEVQVTDANGESHSNDISLPVGVENMAIVIPEDKPRLQFSELKELQFNVVNLLYDGIEQQVNYNIYHGQKLVAQGVTMSDAKDGFRIKDDTQNWESGQYKFEFSAKDDKGRGTKQTFETTLYRREDKCPPIKTDFWFDGDGSFEIEEGEAKTIYIGTSNHDAHLLVLTYDENENETHEWVALDNEIKPFSFKLNGKYLKAKFFMLYKGELHTAKLTLNQNAPAKDLPIKLSVFRDKMQPGSKEKWTLSLPADKAAEVLATMYDASLDKIKSHDWYLPNVYRKSYTTKGWFLEMQEEEYVGFISEHFNSDLERSNDIWSDIYRLIENWETENVSIIKKIANKIGNSRNEEIYTLSEEADCEMVPISEQSTTPPPPPPPPHPGMMRKGMNAMCDDIADETASTKVRTNFAETAFFYPQLTTDKSGNVNLTFTMPESLTRWKFMAMAHTKDLFVGKLTQEVVTQKDFMVSPNYPRFLRNGDECVFTAKLINLSNKALTGNAKLQLLDPVTEKIVIEKVTNFNLQPAKNGETEWTVSIPKQTEALLLRVSAASGNFADAEQKLLPVLSDKVVLTQTLPMVVRGGKDKTYSFDNLKNNKSETLSSRFLKIEMASNPVWYAVQSLPSVANVDHENAISLSAAMFASQMAQQMATSNAKVFNVIEQWRKQGSNKQTLLSNLEKNAEVKNVLLNETPWVMEAKNESERKQLLSTLFDINDLKTKHSAWEKKLNDLQTNEGGWSWFKGMPANQHTTLFVLDNYGRLKKAGIDVSSQNEQIEKAIDYLDTQLAEEYKFASKSKNDYIGTLELYYFQVRSLFNREVAKNRKAAYDYYYGLMKKKWSEFSLQGKAFAAIALYRGGDANIAKEIVASLRSSAITTEEDGMYWPKNTGSRCWEDAAIATHTRLMEALQLVDNKQSEQDELRIWLLNQKRTQNWDNLIATTDALNVLLLNGSNWIDTNNQVTVKLGGKAVEPESKEAATGYYAVSIPGKDIKAEMGDVKLQSAKGSNISWGALYWQFEERIDKIEKNKTGLHIEKTLMLEGQEGNKTVLKTLNEKNELKVGDKVVVRLVLRADRDFDFVSLKDQRASCLEPLLQKSGFLYNQGTGYYQSAKDAAMYYFFDHLRKGTYVFEYPMYVTHKGHYTNGITTVQCLYAPEFNSNTQSINIHIK